jgi:GLPGLI family protein
MKIIIKSLLLFIVVAISFNSCSVFQKGGDTGFQGIVTYNITYEADELSAAEKAQLPEKLVVYIADNKVRNDQVTAFYSMSQISNFNDGSAIVLIDAMGQKIAVKQTKEDIEEAMKEMPTPEIKLIEEAKEIAGYRSKKAEVVMGDDIVEVFYTDELDVPENINDMNGFKGLKGLLMEYTVVQENMIMNFTVSEINQTKVKAHQFGIPDEYEVKSPEELGGLFGM